MGSFLPKIFPNSSVHDRNPRLFLTMLFCSFSAAVHMATPSVGGYCMGNGPYNHVQQSSCYMHTFTLFGAVHNTCTAILYGYADTQKDNATCYVQFKHDSSILLNLRAGS